MNYSFYKTNDKSITLFNHNRNEHYHSFAGAYNEALIKYYQGCHLDKKISALDDIKIFEVGFGLGYNLFPFIQNKNKIKGKATYLSTENDSDLFSFLLDNLDKIYPKEYHKYLIEIFNSNEYEDDHLFVKVIFGDVRNTIKNIDSLKYDAIFHDPFSPYKNTECWTYDFFKEEYKLLKEDGILSTYSMSTPVRSGMYQAGFKVWEGIGDETKSTGTIATKVHLDSLFKLSDKMNNKLISSPDRIPFRDPNLNEDHHSIKNERLLKKNNKDFSDLIKTTL